MNIKSVIHLLVLFIFLFPSAKSFSGDYVEDLKKSEDLADQSLVLVIENRNKLKKDIRSGSKSDASKAVMLALLAWELSDGANGVETGDVLMVAWEHQPQLVSSWFDRKEASKRLWLTSQDYLFNGFVVTGSYLEAEALRKSVIASLDKLESKDGVIKDYLIVLRSLDVPKYE